MVRGQGRKPARSHNEWSPYRCKACGANTQKNDFTNEVRKHWNLQLANEGTGTREECYGP